MSVSLIKMIIASLKLAKPTAAIMTTRKYSVSFYGPLYAVPSYSNYSVPTVCRNSGYHCYQASGDLHYDAGYHHCKMALYPRIHPRTWALELNFQNSIWPPP